MAKRNNIPLKVRNSFVTRQAYKLLLTMGIVSLPVDPFAIVKHFGWRILTVAEAEEYGVKCPFNLSESKPAINFRVPRTGERFIIYYNEKYIPRLRWSIAHEIGHIVLEHKNEFPNRLTESEYRIAELEAHLFAAELLTPTKIVASDLFPKTTNAISTICNISSEATTKRLEVLTGVCKVNALSILSQESEKLYCNMYNYLQSLSKPSETRLKDADIILPAQYEDYCYCDYWGYVKSKMKRTDKRLFELIDDSVAFYDNTKMILFVRNNNATSIDNSQKNTIIEYLTKFTNSPIRNIVSIQMVA